MAAMLQEQTNKSYRYLQIDKTFSQWKGIQFLSSSSVAAANTLCNLCLSTLFSLRTVTVVTGD